MLSTGRDRRGPPCSDASRSYNASRDRAERRFADGALARFGTGLAHLVGDAELMGDGVARRVEPAAASRRMKPALAMLTLRIFAVEQIIGPFCIRHPVVRPRQPALATAPAAELRFP